MNKLFFDIETLPAEEKKRKIEDGGKCPNF